MKMRYKKPGVGATHRLLRVAFRPILAKLPCFVADFVENTVQSCHSGRNQNRRVYPSIYGRSRHDRISRGDSGDPLSCPANAGRGRRNACRLYLQARSGGGRSAGQTHHGADRSGRASGGPCRAAKGRSLSAARSRGCSADCSGTDPGRL